MTSERFWDLIESIDWPRDDYEEAKVDLLMNVAPNEVKELRDELGKRTGILRTLFDQAYDETDANFYVSGDGFDDLVNHVVGLGEEEYERVLDEPELLLKRYNEGDFVESLSYAIPHATEFEKLGLDYYGFRSEKYVSRLEDIAENDRLAEHVREKAGKLAYGMEKFPHIDSLADRLDMEDDEYLDHLIELAEDLDKEIKGWPVRNLISDYRTYMIYNQ